MSTHPDLYLAFNSCEEDAIEERCLGCFFDIFGALSALNAHGRTRDGWYLSGTIYVLRDFKLIKLIDVEIDRAEYVAKEVAVPYRFKVGDHVLVQYEKNKPFIGTITGHYLEFSDDEPSVPIVSFDDERLQRTYAINGEHASEVYIEAHMTLVSVTVPGGESQNNATVDVGDDEYEDE